jgi:uncharacterized membrane protein
MRSRAAIGDHPLHPAIVGIPIGAFTVTLVADLLALTGQPGAWEPTARYALAVGIVGALVAAVFGFVDYFGVEMSRAGKALVAWHLRLNLTAVVLFAVSFWLRLGAAPPWSLAVGASTLAYVVLMGGGWLGGKLVFEHKVGVVEHADEEATAIGQRERL